MVSTPNEPDRSEEPTGPPSERLPTGGRHRSDTPAAPEPGPPPPGHAADRGKSAPGATDGSPGRRKGSGREGEKEFVVAAVERASSAFGRREVRVPKGRRQGKTVLIDLHPNPARFGEQAGRLREAVGRVEHRVCPPNEGDPFGDARANVEHLREDPCAGAFCPAQPSRSDAPSSDGAGRRDEIPRTRPRPGGERTLPGPADHAAHHGPDRSRFRVPSDELHPEPLGGLFGAAGDRFGPCLRGSDRHHDREEEGGRLRTFGGEVREADPGGGRPDPMRRGPATEVGPFHERIDREHRDLAGREANGRRVVPEREKTRAPRR